jgi:MoaA/NifB/PqqE/SkfB family radical SAM enzyme
MEEEHNKITRNNKAFARVTENIKQLIDSWINVSVSCVISDINKKNIFNFLEYITTLWVNNIQLLTPLDEWRAKKNKFWLEKKDFNKIKEKLIKFKNKNTNINLDLPWFDIDIIDWLANKYKDNHKYEFIFWCIWWVSGIRIDPSWNVWICVWWAWKPIANIFKEPMKNIMKKLYDWKLKNVCKMCEWCKSYLKDCQWACYLRFGDKK